MKKRNPDIEAARSEISNKNGLISNNCVNERDAAKGDRDMTESWPFNNQNKVSNFIPGIGVLIPMEGRTDTRRVEMAHNMSEAT